MICAAWVLTAALEGRSAGPADPVVVAVGDLVCSLNDPDAGGGNGTACCCHGRQVASLAAAARPDAVLLLGDNQYPDGTLEDYRAAFEPLWGSMRAVLHPVVGNHEYHTKNAAGYFTYFGAAAGDPSRGWYSFNLGAWHLVMLNSNCREVGGCGPASPQEVWLRSDLASHAGRPTLACWHHPRFSSGKHGDALEVDGLWRALAAARVAVVLNGHDHDYERFVPLDGTGKPASGGMREFVVGTGGKNLRPFTTLRPGSQVRDAGTYGVLQLTLHPHGYDWRFLPAPGGTFTDAGSQSL